MKSLRLYSRIFICSCLAMSPLLMSELAYGQDSSKEQQQSALEAYMTPSRGEVAGQISRGELLPVALKKREKLSPDSVNKAIQSISTLFDFRNSRTGDKYLYQADGSRKILLLRYQRTNQVYEAILDPSTGSYEAKFVDVATLMAPKQVPFEQAPVVAEDEVDVESVAMGHQVQAVEPEMAGVNAAGAGALPVVADGQQAEQAPVAGQAPAVADGQEMPSQAAAALAGLDVANVDDPVQPVDEVLAGKPSPDAEFPENPGVGEELQGGEGHAGGVPEADLPLMDEEEASEPVANPLPTVAEAPKASVREGAGHAYKVTPVPSPSIRAKRQAESDGAFGTLSIVTFITGLFMLLLALAFCVVPSIRARRKCASLGLRIHGMIRVSCQQRIACVEHDDQKFLIGIEQDKITLLAPAPMNFDHFWRQISAKTYWHQMANKRLSGDEFIKILHDFVPYQPSVSEADMEPSSSIVEMHEFRDDLYQADISDYASVEDIEDKILFDVNVLSAKLDEDEAQDLADVEKDQHTAITAVNHVALLDVSDEENSPYRAITAVNHVSLLDESDEENSPYRAITAVNHVALLDAPEAEEPHTAITAVIHAPLLDDDEVQEIYAEDADEIVVYSEDADAASVYPEDDALTDGAGNSEFTAFELMDSDSDESREEMVVVSDSDAENSDDEESDAEESDDEESDAEESDDEESDDEESDDEDSDDKDGDK